MSLFYRSNLSTTKRFLSKAMSSTTPGQILRGTRWDYSILEAVKGDSTHASTVFKAKVLPHQNKTHQNTINPPKWAIIKAALPDDETAKENLDRECQSYGLPGVAKAACFRKLYDVIDNSTIALEWLDTTLAQVAYQPNMDTYVIIKEFLRAALTSCDILDHQGYVNTDYKPANILLSKSKTGRISAKVGDLGLVFPSGDRINAQPYAMRAPEVFLGQACTKPSQVWAIGAMVLCWIMPGVLGALDSPHPLINEAWCMAKIKRLFPNWKIPTPEEVKGYSLQEAVESARIFSAETEELQPILPFEEETRKVEIPQQLRGLLRLMLVVNPDQRPSASSVLKSAEFLAFEKLIGV